ncbi:uroporphyrinogen-III synthase [Thermogemmatispora sp.]|uniref:uroporphyrinogen-III synthase n=1 Tax=Thermogemmatispora sp. TaxID=1968838 RepID=UPI001D8851C1|nr:uroporphyrinogen-III synthase [Thermogemmatispora sp.]MBX5450641.1 uroporphyrinogen-III synthase [Thermogemmatispora sp.]
MVAAEEQEQPLGGRTILVTRAQEQAEALSSRLQALGAETVTFPVIRLAPPEDWGPLDRALLRLATDCEPGDAPYDWLVFTSVNGVRFCVERLRTLGLEPGLLRAARVAAIGPATAAALAEHGVSGVLVPEAYVAEQVASALLAACQQQGTGPQGQRVLLARAAEARRVLADTLRQAGMLVEEVPAYRTLPAADDDPRGQQVLALIKAGRLSLATFTSSSTVRYFMHWLEQACCEHAAETSPAALLARQGVAIACIGPITAAAARALGLQVTIEAQSFTIDGLVSAIVTYYRRLVETLPE